MKHIYRSRFNTVTLRVPRYMRDRPNEVILQLLLRTLPAGAGGIFPAQTSLLLNALFEGAGALALV